VQFSNPNNSEAEFFIVFCLWYNITLADLQKYQSLCHSLVLRLSELTSMEKQLNLMQSQFQMLISTLRNTNKNETERNSIAKNLYDSGLIKEATATSTGSLEQPSLEQSSLLLDQQQEKERDWLIREAGRAAYHANTTNSILTRATSNKIIGPTPTRKKIVVATDIEK
jgi:hypothetical protein